MLKTHPFARYVFHKGLRIQPNGTAIPIKVDYLGLAQHYELNTDSLDFTNDKWVAAFFATCTKVKGGYTPVASRGYGVLYSYMILPKSWDESTDPNQKFTAIGLQPFPRPGEQKAYALRLESNEDLNHQQGVKKNFFRNIDQAGEIIYSQSIERKSYFLSTLEKKATKIKRTKRLSKNAFSLACAKYPVKGLNDQDLMEACVNKGIVFVGSPVVEFSTNHEDAFWKKWHNGGEAEFLSRLVYRRVL